MRENGIVMLVDDDEGINNTYRDFLYYLRPDIKVIQAKNGKEAADKLGELAQTGSLPDSILTDFNMPVMNGLELLKFVRNHPAMKNLRVIMVSGDYTPMLAKNTAELNCRLFEKPVCLTELCSALMEE